MIKDKTRKKVLHIAFLFIGIATIYGVVQGFFAGSPEIGEMKLSADVLFGGTVNISNSMVTMWLVTALLLIFAFFARRNAGLVPTKPQLLAEMAIEFFLNKLEQGLPSRRTAKMVAPLVITIFLIILTSNQLGFFPLIEAYQIKTSATDGSFVHLLRTPTADFSLTIAMAVMVVIFGHIITFSRNPFKAFFNFIKINEVFKIRKFSDIPNALIELLLGVLEIIGEISKVISLSARLFGNIAAEHLVVTVIASLAFFSAYLIPLPFMLIGVLAGTIQAFVFVFLGLEYLSKTISSVPDPYAENSVKASH